MIALKWNKREKKLNLTSSRRGKVILKESLDIYFVTSHVFCLKCNIRCRKSSAPLNDRTLENAKSEKL